MQVTHVSLPVTVGLQHVAYSENPLSRMCWLFEQYSALRLFFQEDYPVVSLFEGIHSLLGCTAKALCISRQVQNRTLGCVEHIHVIKVNCFLIQTDKLI